MALFGQSLGEEEFLAYVLTCLDEECYNALVSSIVTKYHSVVGALQYLSHISLILPSPLIRRANI
jgi:hypothetical protein